MSIVGDAVAGAALSAFFDVLFDKLSSAELLKIFGQENVDAELKNWTKKLRSIRSVLIDAEEKQMTDRFVKTWMAELEDLAYDADDILDGFATEALRRKVKAEGPSTSNIRKFVPACFVGLNPSSIMFDANMRSKIKEINTKLQEIVTRKADLKLEDFARGWTRTITSRGPATSLVESHTFGREGDKDAIIKLLSDESGGAQLSTISILGMGGLGKTTLAKLVYNDDKVGSYFNVKAWVCVSQNFNILRVTKEILQDITSETCKDDSLNLVQRKLMAQLSGKKFLLILDDVWIENYSDWTELRLPCLSGAHGSKILITTREANVSSIMGAPHPYKLRELSNDACLSIFTQHAPGISDFRGRPEGPELEELIIDRCKGLPLVAKALAGLLLTHNRDEWKDVLNGRIWNLLEKKTDVPSTLRLSYLYLPSSLKKCFAYCSLFPKGYNFKEKELVLLWMAEGLVRETEEEKPMEDLGAEYFHDLLKRSFFQQSSINESRFVMHDLMHDLAQWAAGDFYCRLEDQVGGSKISTKVRHFSYIEQSHDCIQKFDDFPKNVHLRTFLSLPVYNRYGSTNFDVKYCLLPQLRCLRVLSLSRNDIFELPSSIGDLKHLRYLNLSYTKIKSLPESTSSLYNLQILILKGCFYLTKLPEKIENLVNLRHLNITSSNSIREMPAGIAKLKSLRTLCFEDMDEWQDWIPCEELPYLYELSISNCPSLKCVSTIVDLASMLKRLHIKKCPNLTSLSSRDALPTTLKVLKLVDCPKLESIVDKLNKDTLLEHLLIDSCEKLRCLPRGLHELCHLKTIDIYDCNSLISLGDLLPTNLRSLQINNCEKLEALPNNMHNLNSLQDLSILARLGRIISFFPEERFPTQDLSILDCPSIISFPEEGFPTNLIELRLSGANICKQVFELGLHRLTSLTYLLIGNGIIDSFPEEEDGKTMLMLPTSLTTLRFYNFPNLLFLSWKFFQNLSALEEISIGWCPKLASLSEKCFPPSLQRLEIFECSVLKQNYKKHKGIMWSKMANIPSVKIDWMEQQK